MYDEEEGLLRVRDVLPRQYWSVFNHSTFNHMQSLLVNQALSSSMNMVVAAPTGCGKTAVHELAIIRLMMKYAVKQMKVVYIAPNKALCQQKVEDWSAKFSAFGVSVLEVTGDIEFKYCLQMVAKATIIVTTPEKWDSLTRSWRDHVFLLGAIDLLLIDEVHHLGEDRGSTLEIVVVRMRLLNRTYLAKKNQYNSTDVHDEMRIIALSATLPNLSDIGEWIHCDPTAVHHFDESFRPVPLTVHTLGFGTLSNPFLFERSLDEKVAEVIQRFSDGKQTLIFCSSKKSTESLASLLAKRLGISHPAAADAPHFASLQDTTLRRLVQVGYAYHHSGLSADDRAAVEQLYLSGSIAVLCSTSTLAHGVNLPAHLVIIKGTNCWRGGTRGYEKMNRSEIIQMLGRAGRPGFDTEGVAVIMTSAQDRDHYAAISLSAEVVESTLQSMLTEAICSEISQNVICSVTDCVDWIKSTYFYVRVKVNPGHYQFPIGASDEQREALLIDLCNKAVRALHESKIIDVSAASDPTSLVIQPKPETHIMSRNMIRFDTMKMLVGLPSNYSLQQLLRDFSTSIEVSKPVRKLEKRILNDMLRSLRFPLRAAGHSQSTRVQEPWQKAFVLMQAAVARLDLKDFSLRVEQSEIVECGLRVLSALAELCRTRGAGPLLEHTILLDRALRVRCWDYNYGSVFVQCLGLTDQVRNGLTLNCVRTENDVEGCTLTKVQSMAHCSASEARSILHFANILKMTKLRMNVVIAPDHARLTVTLNPIESSESGSNPPLLPLDQIVTYQLLCYDTSSSSLLLYRRLDTGAWQQTNNIFSVTIPSTTREVRCCLLGNVVGNDVCRVFINSDAGETIIAPKPTLVVTDLSAKYNKGNNCAKKHPAHTAKEVTSAVPPSSSSTQTQLRIPYQPIAKSRECAPAQVPASPHLSISPHTVSSASLPPSASTASTHLGQRNAAIDFDALLKMLECPSTPPDPPQDPSVRAFLNGLESLPPTPPSSPIHADASMSEEIFQPRVTVKRKPQPQSPYHQQIATSVNSAAQPTFSQPAIMSRDLSLLRSKASEMGFSPTTNVKRIKSQAFPPQGSVQLTTQAIGQPKRDEPPQAISVSRPQCSFNDRPFFSMMNDNDTPTNFDVDGYFPYTGSAKSTTQYTTSGAPLNASMRHHYPSRLKKSEQEELFDACF